MQLRLLVALLGFAGLALAGCQPVDLAVECARYFTEKKALLANLDGPPPELDIFEQSKWLNENITPELQKALDGNERTYQEKLGTSDPRTFCLMLTD